MSQRLQPTQPRKVPGHVSVFTRFELFHQPWCNNQTRLQEFSKVFTSEQTVRRWHATQLFHACKPSSRNQLSKDFERERRFHFRSGEKLENKSVFRLKVKTRFCFVFVNHKPRSFVFVTSLHRLEWLSAPVSSEHVFETVPVVREAATKK